MLTINIAKDFEAWLKDRSYATTQRRIPAKLRKASAGLRRNVSPQGTGVLEMRDHFGPRHRIYFKQHGATFIVILAELHDGP